MSKLRVHDMAGEFGISAEEVLALLRQMDVPVRSHLSVLSDDQVARVRARWEREKRARAERPAAATSTRRRRGAAVEQPAAKAEVPAPAEDAAPVRRRRRAAPEPSADDTAEDTSDAEETPLVEGAGLVDVSESVEAAAAQPEVDDVDEGVADEADEDDYELPAAAAPARTAEPPVAHRPPPRSRPAQEGGPPRARPRPIVPGAPRSASRSVPFPPPRPVASATPGSVPTVPARRDDRKPGAAGGGPPQRRKKGRRGAVDQEAVSQNISRTMTAMRSTAPRRGRRPDDGAREEIEAQRAAEAEREKLTVRVNEFITVSELAEILKVPATQIVAFAFKNLGLVVTINQRLDFDQIELIAGEFGFHATREEEYLATPATEEDTDKETDLEPRPPVVTVMGHVDHGKTSLLDHIRKANVVAGEAGGITQHIGAYHVTLPNGKRITFLDTPGHEAFTAMRARGAQVTDIVVLVVAADDRVMPQTIEAISHARNAGVPIIVAINKIDLAGADPDKVKQDLLQHGVVLEEYGGQTLATAISAKSGANIDQLLEQVLLQAEILDLKANPNRRAQGKVVEAQLDAGKGPVATILITNGTLRVGDDFVCGMFHGRVRAMLDERGHAVTEAPPAIPVQVLGLAGVPMAGDQLTVLADSAETRELAQRRQRLDREAKSRRTSKGVASLADFMEKAAAGEKPNLRIVIKADQGGPAEALADALGQLSGDEAQVEVIHRGVGAITESDILLARASGAIIVGFHVRPDSNARTAAEREGVEIKLYRVIYDAVADIRNALEGLLRPEQREVVFAEAEVRETFKVPRVGVIAGSYVRNGTVTRQGRVRVVRDGTEVYNGTIGSLRRFKDDVREVREGFECGIGVENFNDLKVGDVLEFYKTESIARTLSGSGAASGSSGTAGQGRANS